MSGYWRSIVYLKESNGAEESCGFGKLEFRGNCRKIWIQIRRQGTESTNWKAYIGTKEGGRIHFSFIGDLEEKDDGYLLTKEEKTNKIEEKELIIVSENGKVLCDGNLKAYEFCFEEKIEQSTQKEEKAVPEPELEKRAEQKPMQETAEVYAAETQSQKEKEWFLTLMDKTEEMYPFEDNEWKQCAKLETSDFGMLPAKYWSLGSNSFLLNGYYGYRHLLFAMREGKQGVVCSLGVPGVYHRREIFMAKMFGFPEFKGVKGKSAPSLGDFGYWMMELKW